MPKTSECGRDGCRAPGTMLLHMTADPDKLRRPVMLRPADHEGLTVHGASYTRNHTTVVIAEDS